MRAAVSTAAEEEEEKKGERAEGWNTGGRLSSDCQSRTER